jgi:hypothetical protein
MMIQNPNQLKASAEFTQTIISRLATEKGVHAETAISAASRMAGTFALRSCGLPLAQFTPGTPIFGEAIDEQGNKVLNTVGETLAGMDIELDPRRINYDLLEANSPHMELAEVQSMLDASFRAIADKYHLTAEEGAHAAAVSAAVLIQKCSACLDPHVAYTVAMYGMVEACKTVPVM